MLFSKVALVLAIVPFSIAIDCTTSNAIDWPISGGTSSGSSGDSSGDTSGDSSDDSTPVGAGGSSSDPCAQFSNNAAALEACYGNVQIGECNSVGCTGDDGSTNGNLIDGGSGVTDDPSDGLIKKRATLTCSSSETCYLYTNASLLCLDLDTGDYQNEFGGSGNLITGEYTEPDGETTTTSEGAIDLIGDSSTSAAARSTSAGVSAATTSATLRTVSTTASSRTTTSPTGTAASSASAASPTSTNAAEMLRAGSIVGALGLVAGFVL